MEKEVFLCYYNVKFPDWETEENRLLFVTEKESAAVEWCNRLNKLVEKIKLRYPIVSANFEEDLLKYIFDKEEKKAESCIAWMSYIVDANCFKVEIR